MNTEKKPFLVGPHDGTPMHAIKALNAHAAALRAHLIRQADEPYLDRMDYDVFEAGIEGVTTISVREKITCPPDGEMSVNIWTSEK